MGITLLVTLLVKVTKLNKYFSCLHVFAETKFATSESNAPRDWTLLLTRLPDTLTSNPLLSCLPSP